MPLQCGEFDPVPANAEAAGAGLVRVRELTVVAAVTATRTAGAGLQLRVPVVGAKLGAKYQHKRSDTQRVEIVLAPPPEHPITGVPREVQWGPSG
ncbi:trypco2 family protein [Paractinoplanes lichenicola]|uniref:Trypsin-co-occurring domain-containing protein n=1 Tax=Paractinoplanes lichenicola TaxID=2802976 RepID=A0ABS1W1S8_9ACTN|nr:trypco2 family protein [Actinoplanes lichenicola]MBL7260653.1 hypothetical protein [Actinoplanes lichenicola]